MVFLKVDNLLNDCATYKGRLRVKRDRKLEIYKEIWSALNEWICDLFTSKRGADMPLLGKITWCKKDYYDKESGKYKDRYKPRFLVSKSFVLTYHLDQEVVQKFSNVAQSDIYTISNADTDSSDTGIEMFVNGVTGSAKANYALDVKIISWKSTNQMTI